MGKEVRRFVRARRGLEGRSEGATCPSGLPVSHIPTARRATFLRAPGPGASAANDGRLDQDYSQQMLRYLDSSTLGVA